MPWGESLSRSLQACSSVTACWIGLFTDTMMKHLQSMDAARSFSEFRQEASMLHSLPPVYRGSGGHQHPPALLRPGAGAAGQPQHHPGGASQRSAFAENSAKHTSSYDQATIYPDLLFINTHFYLKVKQCIFNIWDFKKNISLCFIINIVQQQIYIFGCVRMWVCAPAQSAPKWTSKLHFELRRVKTVKYTQNMSKWPLGDYSLKRSLS